MSLKIGILTSNEAEIYHSEKECQETAEFNIDQENIHQVSIIIQSLPTENSAINNADGSLWSHGRSLTINISIVQCKGMARAPVHWEYIKDCQLHLGNQ